jgi:hypothetical protein
VPHVARNQPAFQTTDVALGKWRTCLVSQGVLRLTSGRPEIAEILAEKDETHKHPRRARARLDPCLWASPIGLVGEIAFAKGVQQQHLPLHKMRRVHSSWAEPDDAGAASNGERLACC